MKLRIATKADVRESLADLSPAMQRLLLEAGGSSEGVPVKGTVLSTRRALCERGLVAYGVGTGNVTLTTWGYDVLKELRRQRRAWAKSLQAEIQAGVIGGAS